jgi:hypothetical protein
LDSDFSWGQFTVELGWRDAVTHTQTNQAFYEQYCAGTLNIADHVRFSTESLREQGMAAAHAAHERFMRDVIRPAMRPAFCYRIRDRDVLRVRPDRRVQRRRAPNRPLR